MERSGKFPARKTWVVFGFLLLSSVIFISTRRGYFQSVGTILMARKRTAFNIPFSKSGFGTERLTVYSASLEQFERYKTLKLFLQREEPHSNKPKGSPRQRIIENARKIRVTVMQVDSHRPNPQIVLILVEEDKKNIKNLGGSTFTVIANGTSFIYRCPVKDNFDGTYTAHCPMLHVECVSLTVKLQFPMFSAYWKYPPCGLDKLVWNDTLCPSKIAYSTKPMLTSHSHKCTNMNFTDSRNVMYWRKSVNGMLWTMGDCVVPINNQSIQQKRWKSCVASHSSINMYGDSHIRYTWEFILGHLGGIEHEYATKFNASKTEKSLAMKSIQFSTHLRDSLLSQIKLFKNIPLSKKNVVIFDNGHWDLIKITIEDYMKKVKLWLDVLEKIAKDPHLRKARWIFHTMPAPAESYKKCVTGYNRRVVNDFDSAATIGFLLKEFQRRKLYPHIELFNFHEMLIHRNEETASGDKPNVHFLYPDKDNTHYKLDKFTGTVGKQIVDVLLELLCPQDR